MMAVSGVTHSGPEVKKRVFVLNSTELFLAVPWVCLRFVIVVFPDHTNSLFSNLIIVNVKMRTIVGILRLLAF